jgi:hypothetical protein
MRFSLFYEHQLPRPWGEDSERRLLEDALEQIVVAERAGFDRIWEVEHHFLPPLQGSRAWVLDQTRTFDFNSATRSRGKPGKRSSSSSDSKPRDRSR